MGLEKEIDENQKLVRKNTSHKIKPALRDSHKGAKIKEIIKETLLDKLQGKVYNADEVKNWVKDICDTVNVLIHQRIIMPRFKHVVQVMLGQQIGSGCHYVAKCFWDVDSDSYTSDAFHNSTMFCICTVYSIYLY